MSEYKVYIDIIDIILFEIFVMIGDNICDFICLIG